MTIVHGIGLALIVAAIVFCWGWYKGWWAASTAASKAGTVIAAATDKLSETVAWGSLQVLMQFWSQRGRADLVQVLAPQAAEIWLSTVPAPPATAPDVVATAMSDLKAKLTELEGLFTPTPAASTTPATPAK